MRHKLAAWGILVALMAGPASAQEAARVYFRADVGGALSSDASIRDRTPGRSFNNLCDGAGACGFELDEIGNSVSGSVGVGYRFDQNFRSDLTFSYRPGFELDDSIASFFGGNDTHRADIENMTIMLSGYFDLNMNMGGFRPYIGGGVGWARNEIESTTVTNPVGGLTRTHGGSTENDFAWQIGVGASIDLNAAMLLDLGYRYVDAGGLDSGASTVSGTAGGAFGPIPFNGVTGDVRFHEFTLGLRF